MWRIEGDNYAPDNPNSDRVNATLLSLVRNSELDDMLQSMRDLERTFNRKFNYPWLFLNDVPFTDEFKKKISAETKAKVTFGKVGHRAHKGWILTVDRGGTQRTLGCSQLDQ
jgi:mannosyltransferase